MKVFVTGGNGFIGARVVRRLLAEGHSVRCLLRASSNTRRIDGLGVERHEGDVRDRRSLVAGMEGCDGAIHLASLSSWEAIRSPLMREIVIDGTRNLLEAARAAGTPSRHATPAIRTRPLPRRTPARTLTLNEIKRVWPA